MSNMWYLCKITINKQRDMERRTQFCIAVILAHGHMLMNKCTQIWRKCNLEGGGGGMTKLKIHNNDDNKITLRQRIANNKRNNNNANNAKNNNSWKSQRTARKISTTAAAEPNVGSKFSFCENNVSLTLFAVSYSQLSHYGRASAVNG